MLVLTRVCLSCIFFFQAEDGIRDLVRSRGLGDVYKRQMLGQIYPIFMQATRRFSHVSYAFKFVQGLSRSTVLQYILRYILFILSLIHI